ncbi:16S rRNA (uracil(1498)-N(3))-methyltransferase [Arthrobacter sp. H41]|uniref:16S rRNA (uracil(1498)-N(3))-methyltransferase n=1 Tax=Arthrobacter sp. H41 TaxID=1312978 RepID=UPI00047E5077|nr:16S rRNA (uracil(1498)-N(3))-methyltransferase [Arthrobacter sp. H41]
MTNPLFLGDPAAVRSATAGGVFELRGEEARHAATVRRMEPGEAVDIADGAGFRLSGTVLDAAPALLAVAVGSAVQEDPPRHRLVLVQALAKGDRDEQAIEAATELGVDGVVPWQSERCIVRWRGEKADKGRQKWGTVVRGAAKQSRRAFVPSVYPLMNSTQLTTWIPSVDRVFVLSEDAVDSLADRIAASGAGAPASGGTTAVVVGPEGGISGSEIEGFVGAGALTARLGPHVLRSSSAGPAALVLLNQLLGRW